VAKREWVVLELSPQGEDEDPEVLSSALVRLIRDKAVEIFIPASISIQGDSRVIHKLIDNYVFIRRTLPDNAFLRLEGTKYISSVLTIARSDKKTTVREMACVQDSDIERMRKQIHVETEQGIEVGDEVQVMSGAYKGINGRIIEEIPENDSVQVFIKLRSKEAIVTLPRSFLRFVSKDQSDLPTFSPFLTKIERIRDWVRAVRPLLVWDPLSIQPLEHAIKRYANVELAMRWWHRRDPLLEQMRLIERVRQTPDADLAPLLRKHEEFSLVNGWLRQDRSLVFLGIKTRHERVKHMTSIIQKNPGFFYSVSTDPVVSQSETQILNGFNERVKTKQRETQWLQDVVRRLDSIARDLDNIEALTWRRPDMFENIIIDGHNLAYRVANALGVMKTPLTDSDGNPTGMVFGFLKSLTSYKKRFPNAKVYVVWDGSPQRRIEMFPGYKLKRRQKRASNGATTPDNQMTRLRNILPTLGVTQAFNKDEETDDIIACLVRGKLKGQRNVIVSTDQDFLQLVTLTDIVLAPKVGNRQETLYDRDKVVEEYGVTPESLVQLRALLGDTSDEIPGIPMVSDKILTGLLKNYGTVEDMLASNLSGTTPKQYAKIRSAGDQVRLNLKLMTLLTDLPFEEIPPTPDAKTASETIGGLNIQADPIVDPFFQTSVGFVKQQQGQFNFES